MKSIPISRVKFYTENSHPECPRMWKYSEVPSSISKQQLNSKADVSETG